MANPAQQVYGPIVVGTIINIFLYGITVTQTYIYYSQFKRDQRWMKIFVFLLLLLDTANTCLDIVLFYDPLVTNFGNPEVLVKGSIFWGADPGAAAIITLMVQLFFAWRLRILLRNPWIVAFVVVGAIASCAGAVATAVSVTHVLYYARFQEFKSVVILWLVCAAVVDATITAALVWHLRKNKTGMTITDGIVDKIIRVTVQTGLITSVCAIVDLTAYLVSTSTIHLIFNLPLPKLYTNTLMSSLNSRRGWQYDDSDGQTLERSGNVSVNLHSGERSKQHHSQQIFVNVESHELVDVADMKGSPYGSTGPPSTLSLPNKKLDSPKARSIGSPEYV